jgi:co-chaperonin GroES (HSP10)
MLCIVPAVDEKLAGTSLDLIRDAATMRIEESATTVLWVMKLGPDAYKDTAKFPSGPWCKEGDFVLVRTYTGTRFRVFGKEFRVLNDDQIECVVQDPRGYTRA